MPNIIPGILMLGIVTFGGYFITKCICLSNTNIKKDYYIITKEQLDELKNTYNNTQPTINPPEYTSQVVNQPMTST